MATTTPNYGLTKPDLTELYDIGVQNTNMDLIDSLTASQADLAEINSDYNLSAQSSSVNVPTVGTPSHFTDIMSFTLTAGTWLVNANINFASNATGYRAGLISSTSESTQANVQSTVIVGAASGAVTRFQITWMVSLPSTTTFYVEAQQNSGSTLACYARVHKIKLR